jgi:hypothetical protein
MSEMRMSRRDLVATAAVLPLAAAVSATTAEATHRQQRVHDRNMEAALADLQSAREHLQRAGGGAGGHRAEAIRLVQAAIDQVEEGIDFAT